MSHSVTLTKFYKRRKRMRDGTLCYVAEGFEIFGDRQSLGPYTRRVKKEIRHLLKAPAIVEPHGRSKWWHRFRIYVANETDFVMLKLGNPEIVW